MKLVILLALCALAAAAPQNAKEESFDIDVPEQVSPASRNILVNMLVRQLIAYVRRIINNGSVIFGIPPLDPLDLDQIDVTLPPNELLELDLHLKDIHARGLGGFVVHKSSLQIRHLTFDLDISVPHLVIYAGDYDLFGNLFGALPLYGKGNALFELKNFRFQCLLHLKQSENGKSVVLDRVENAAFQLPYFKSDMTGIIGGGDIDGIVNALLNEVLIDYINRFDAALSAVVARAAPLALNPILETLDTWRYLAPFV